MHLCTTGSDRKEYTRIFIYRGYETSEFEPKGMARHGEASRRKIDLVGPIVARSPTHGIKRLPIGDSC